jgi:hypothetical protein
MPPWIWIVVVILVLAALGAGWIRNRVFGTVPPAGKTAAWLVGFFAIAGFLGGGYGITRSIFLTNYLAEGLGRTPTDKGVVSYLTHGFYCHEHPNPTQCPGGINHDPPPPPPPFW